MDRFEYDVTLHQADAFKKVVYFCSDAGNCSVEQVPADEPDVLVEILNDRGLDGWELVQLQFGKDGVMAVWKRRLPEGLMM